jgi:hypothetical protein
MNSNNEFKTIEDSNFLYSRNHPNIVKYKDGFENETNNTMVFITEYLNVSVELFLITITQLMRFNNNKGKQYVSIYQQNKIFDALR